MKTYRSRPDLQHRQNVEFNKKYYLKNIFKTQLAVTDYSNSKEDIKYRI